MAGNDKSDELIDDPDSEEDIDSEEEDGGPPPGLSGEEELDQIYSERVGAAIDDEEEQEPRTAPGARRREGDDAVSAILEDAVEKAARAGPLLRAQLSGTITMEVTDKQQQFRFDGRGEKPALTRVKNGASSADEADCTISMSSIDLARIANGHLNAQVAMLSHKINVQGRVGLALYFFNLFR